MAKDQMKVSRKGSILKIRPPLFAAAGTGAMHWRARAQAAQIKIGLLAPLTGVVASGGKEMVEGSAVLSGVGELPDRRP